jgi:hypothetical protein
MNKSMYYYIIYITHNIMVMKTFIDLYNIYTRLLTYKVSSFILIILFINILYRFVCILRHI